MKKNLVLSSLTVSERRYRKTPEPIKITENGPETTIHFDLLNSNKDELSNQLFNKILSLELLPHFRMLTLDMNIFNASWLLNFSSRLLVKGSRLKFRLFMNQEIFESIAVEDITSLFGSNHISTFSIYVPREQNWIKSLKFMFILKSFLLSSVDTFNFIVVSKVSKRCLIDIMSIGEGHHLVSYLPQVQFFLSPFCRSVSCNTWNNVRLLEISSVSEVHVDLVAKLKGMWSLNPPELLKFSVWGNVAKAEDIVGVMLLNHSCVITTVSRNSFIDNLTLRFICIRLARTKKAKVSVFPTLLSSFPVGRSDKTNGMIEFLVRCGQFELESSRATLFSIVACF